MIMKRLILNRILKIVFLAAFIVAVNIIFMDFYFLFYPAQEVEKQYIFVNIPVDGMDCIIDNNDKTMHCYRKLE